MATYSEFVKYTAAYARSKGLDPRIPVGIAQLEKSWAFNPGAWSNVDRSVSGKYGVSYGPFQDRISAQGGLGTMLMGRGIDVTNPANWQQITRANVDYMAEHGVAALPRTWMSIGNNGGIEAVKRVGASVLARHGGGGDARGAIPALGADPQGGAFGLGGPNPSAAGGDVAVDAANPRGATQGIFTGQKGIGTDTLAGMWEAMGVTAVTSAGKTVAESNKASSERVSKAVEGSTEKAVTATGGFLDTLLASTRDLFVRGGLLVLGALLLLGGVLYFSRKGD